jgi:hypothetical protein
MKRIVLALAALFAVSAQAETWNSPMADSGWAFAGGTATATSVTAMHMLMQSSTAVKKGHWYRIAGTVSGYSGSGSLRAFVGYSMPAAPTGSWVTLASTSDIADNFTTASGLVSTTAKPTGGPGDSSETGGAIRFQCSHAKFGLEDPVVYPGLASGHLHEIIGNTALDRNTTTTTIRTKGMTTCGDPDDPLHPVNRSAYWWPAVLNTHIGAVVKASGSQIYYKGPVPSTSTINWTGQLAGSEFGQLECAEVSPTSDCRMVPRGMKYVVGYNKATGNCGPTDVSSGCTDGEGFTFSCQASPASGGAQIGPLYTTMEAARASGNCAVGGQLRIVVSGRGCWDGVNIDSPNHRDHVSGAAAGVDGNTTHFGHIRCPVTHPVSITGFSSQNWYPIDQDFMDGYWKLSSDEMATSCAGGTVVAGCTSHLDYMFGWSPAAIATAFERCINNHNSCSSGDLGDGTRLKKGGGLDYDGGEMICNGCSKARPDRYVPTRLYGMSKDIKANGAFSFDIRAADNGVWGLMGLGSLNATVTGVTMVEIASGAKGPVTVHN